MKYIPFTGGKSLDGILATFKNTLNDLQALRDRHASVVSDNSATISSLKAENIALSQESDRAAAVHAKISELIA